MKSCIGLKDCGLVKRIDSSGRTPGVGDVHDLEIRNRIFKKVAQRLGELGIGSGEPALDFCPELMPDIIVIPDDQSLLFEAQNARTLETLAHICGFAFETMSLSERIRVRHCRSRQIIEQLKAAGATVSGEF